MGVAVDNAYGVAFHSTVLDVLGVEANEIEAMRAGNPPTDQTHAAVYAFARAVVLDRGAVDRAVIEQASAVGLDGSSLLQLVTECVFASLVGIVDNLDRPRGIRRVPPGRGPGTDAMLASARDRVRRPLAHGRSAAGWALGDDPSRYAKVRPGR